MKKPKRSSEATVARYWLDHDSAEEIDWRQPGVQLQFDPDAERPTQPITVQLPSRLLRELHVLAKDRDVPYEALVKMLLAEKVAELRRKAP